MGILEGRLRRWTCVRALVLVATLGAIASPAAAAYAPTADDRALLAFANLARAQHGLPPLVWHDGLGQAAYVNSSAVAARGGNCDPHNCAGEWWRRIERYYPGNAYGENSASNVPNPRALHDGWMTSSSHRANILSAASEFGAAIVLGETAIGLWGFATEDFGSRASVTIPTLPAGGVAPRIALDPVRELVVNYYDPAGGPKAVRALVGSSCVPLSRVAGNAKNGTYGTFRTFTGSGCVPVVFEAISADGVRHRWPKSEAILVGVGLGGLYCADTTTAVPTQDCGGGGAPPAPVPTPTPAPAPGDSGLSKMRVVLRPGPANRSAGVVQVDAILPALDDFTPVGSPLTVRVRYESSGDWSRTIPASCGSRPCLKGNKRETVFRGNYETSTATMNRQKDGRWKFRFVARKQTLGNVDSGEVRVTVTVDGRTFEGTADGYLKPSGLVAD